jgi:hypothetical protein
VATVLPAAVATVLLAVAALVPPVVAALVLPAVAALVDRLPVASDLLLEVAAADLPVMVPLHQVASVRRRAALAGLRWAR